jgi:hypothetical protein
MMEDIVQEVNAAHVSIVLPYHVRNRHGDALPHNSAEPLEYCTR